MSPESSSAVRLLKPPEATWSHVNALIWGGPRATVGRSGVRVWRYSFTSIPRSGYDHGEL